jgi:ABC-type multidrug transport system fused ATPase/permease subunit
VAFVGRSGAGKSSTIHLIERFFDPTTGQVFLDGHDIRTESVQTHRARLALVVSVPSLCTLYTQRGSVLFVVVAAQSVLGSLLW